MRAVLAGFLVVLAVIYARVIALEWHYGQEFRAAAQRPLIRQRVLPAARGRILARDGTVLAEDRPTSSLCVHYRWLEEPPNPRWLRQQARAQLEGARRKDPQRLASAEVAVLRQRSELHQRLAALCGVEPNLWDQRRSRVQARIEAISHSVNRRRLARYEAQRESSSDVSQESGPSESSGGTDLAGKGGELSNGSSGGEHGSWWQLAKAVLAEALFDAGQQELPPPPIVVAEELQHHPMAGNLPLELVAEIEAYPQQYPGVTIQQESNRYYPRGTLAAHVVGYLGAPTPDELEGDIADAATTTDATDGANTLNSVITPDARDTQDSDAIGPDELVGRLGIEHQYQSWLRGNNGRIVEATDHAGHVLRVERNHRPIVGGDILLTLDRDLQRTAETLLDQALVRVSPQSSGEPHTGGAVIVMDVRNGAILAAASAPRFDPNLFVRRDPGSIQALLDDPSHALFDRTMQMALPPGSVFKTVTSVALLESGQISPDATWDCRGYLHRPDRWRCLLYQRQGIGHGPVGLEDALAYSCNTFFFHHAGEMGPAPLVRWSGRFGFGRQTGIDLPGESGGFLPTPSKLTQAVSRDPADRRTWLEGDSRSVAVGQGTLTATPLQVVRMMAAVANGGSLVTPHLALRLSSPAHDTLLEWDADETPLMAEDPRSDSQVGSTGHRPMELGMADGPLFAPSQPIEQLRPEVLAQIRRGLERVVSDPDGTAHETVALAGLSIAGKTGTAQTGGQRGDHAWFAGYAPTDRPRIALVVVLEHGGSGGRVAGPVAQRLMIRLAQLGYIRRGSTSRVEAATFEDPSGAANEDDSNSPR
jgi:penicillin-binding protein 2